MAEELEAGTAYLQLMASARDLQGDVNKKVKKVKAPDILAKIDGEITALEKKVAKARDLKASVEKRAVAKIDAEIGGFEKKAAQARAEMERLRTRAADPQIGLDIAELQARSAQVRAELERLRGLEASPKVDADIAIAEAKLGRIESRTAALEAKRSTVQLDADTTRLQAEIDAAEAKVAELSAARATAHADADTSKLDADIDAAEAKIRRLESRRATVQIGQNGAAGTIAALDVVDGKRRRVDGSNASVSIAAAGGAQASGMLGLIVAGLAAVSAAAPAAVAGVGAVLGAASAGGQVLGAVKAGFSGIGDAIKSVESDEKSAATSSAGAAKSRTGSANQVASAQAGLAQAVTQADRAAITSGQQVASARLAAARSQVSGSEQVADAAKAEQRARQQADRTSITSGEQVAAARRAVTDAVTAAANQTSAAERSVGRAQDTARYSQESLTRARRDAVEANEDLQLSLSGTAIAERRAALNLRKAQAAAAAGTPGDEELQLDVDEAVQQLAEVRERYGDLSEQQAQFAKTGVEGTDQVVSANRALRDSQSSVADAVNASVAAQRDGARSISDAVVASSRAQRQAAWDNADAQAAVTDASIASGRAARAAAEGNIDAALAVQQAVQSSSWAQADAATGVESAQRSLASALASTADSAGTAGAAGKKSAYDLAQLTPAGREYVAFWTGEWKPALQGVTDTVAGELLPRITTAQRSVISLLPELSRGLAGTGAVVGDLAIKGGQLATSGAFRRDFAAIMDSNNRSLGSYGDAALSSTDSLRALTVAGLPLSERLARTADYAMQGVESFLLQKESTGELGQAMELGATKAGQLVSVSGDLLGMAYQLVTALQPVGSVVLDVVGGVASATGEFIKANPELTQFIATAGLGVATLNALAKGTVALQASAAIAAGGAKTLYGVLSTGLNPSALAATSGLRSFSDWGQRAGLAASTFGAGLTGSVKAGNAAGASVSWLARTTTNVASALPLVGTAFAVGMIAADAFGTSAEEAAASLAKGGAAAASTRAELAANDAAFLNSTNSVDAFNDGVARTINSWLGIRTTSADARAAIDEQRKSMSNLELAQSLATEAQGNYEQAVKDFGAQSPQAVGAMAQLRDRTRDVEIAQIAVREKVDLATAAVLYQRDQLLGALDANLRARQAAQGLARDQQGLADAVNNYGAESQEAKDAGLQLEGSQLRAAQAARDSAGGQGAYVQSIRDMVAATKGEFTPTLAGLVQSLDWAGLSAAGAKVQFNDAGQAVATFPNGKTVVLDANVSPAVGQIGFVKTLVDGTRGTIGIDADPGPAVATVGGFKLATDATTGTVTVNGNISPADQARLGIQAKTDGTTGTMWIDGNPVPCDGKLNGARISVDRTTGVMSIDANKDPADAQSRRAHDFASQGQAFGVDANTKPAEGTLKNFFTSTIPSMVSHIFGRAGMNEVRAAFGMAPLAEGGLVPTPGYRNGGLLRGPGTGTSDSILGLSQGGTPTARVSAGEYVVNADTTRRLGVGTMDAINGLRRGGLVGLAAGGPAPTGAAPTAAPADVAAVVAPTGDPAAVAATASATDSLTGSMDAAALAAAVLTPELAALAATQSGLVAPATAAVALGQQQLVATGITPLVGSLVSTLFPTLAVYDQQVGVASVGANTALQGAQAVTQGSTTATAVNTAANSAAMTSSTTGMSLTSQAQLAGLRGGQQVTQGSTYAMAANNAGQNNAMISSTGFMSAQNQGHLAGLRAAQGATTAATTVFADSWRAQLGRTVPDSANPIRWVMNFPMRSLVDAWNNLDRQFALGKPVAPVLPGFAGGGLLRGPGTGTSDSITGVDAGGAPIARVSAGEYVMPAARTKPHLGFLEALRRGQPEAVQAAGGRGASMPGYAGGGMIAAQQFAKAQAGKPYIWGGVGPAGYDCSGLWSAITNVARGDAPYRRLGVAAGVPWPGFVNGLNSSLAMGANSHHTAGTIGGLNAEARQSGTPVLVGPAAVGADNSQFTRHVSLPQVGGQFVSGGQGGGAGIDPGPIVDAAFAKAYREVADVPKFNGPSPQVGRDQGIAKAGVDGARATAMAKLTELFSAAALGPLGSGAPFYVGEISRAAKVRGLGVDGATIGVATALVESAGLHMYANAKVPGSLRLPHDRVGNDHDSVGLFQQRQAGWGSLEQRMNAFASAGMFFDRLMHFNWRAMDPGAAAQKVQVSAFPGRYSGEMGRARQLVGQYGGVFDQGGIANGTGIMMKDVIAPERVLSPVETRSYNTLEQTLGRNGMRIDAADLAGPGPAAFPDRVRLEATGLEIRGDGLIDIIDGQLVGLAETINDGG